jgi:hypothetical protein
MRDTIFIHQIYPQSLFRWFAQSVHEECGDGWGAIICSNYPEVSIYFEQWCKTQDINYIKCSKKNIDEDHISFSDGDEHYIFTDDIDIKMFPGDYKFVIKEDCKDKFGVLLAIK